MSQGALEGVKVLEYCHTVAGAYCGKLLAELGAEVIKIEKPRLGDDARRQGPFPRDLPDAEKSALFLYVNANKLGVTLEPSSPEGRDIFLEVAEKSDVVLEDYPPGSLNAMGLGYSDLARVRPDLVLASITPFGQTGPYARYHAFGLNVYHASGVGYLTPEGWRLLVMPPLKRLRQFFRINFMVAPHQRRNHIISR